MKGDLIIPKKYVDVVGNFLFGETCGPLMLVLMAVFVMSMMIILMCIVPIFGYIDHTWFNNAISNTQTTWLFYGQFVIWEGNVVITLLEILFDLIVGLTAYAVIAALCDAAIWDHERNKDRL